MQNSLQQEEDASFTWESQVLPQIKVYLRDVDILCSYVANNTFPNTASNFISELKI